MPAQPPRPARNRLRRRLLVVLGAGTVGLALLIASFPTLVGTRFVRDQILARINDNLAPGRLEVDRFEVSWTDSTRLIGCNLIAPDGTQVVAVPVAGLNLTLGSLIFHRDPATVLTLDHATLAIERHLDGKLNLTEALQTVIAHANPKRDLAIRIKDGTISVRSAGLADPLIVGTADLDLAIPPSPGAMTWDLKISRPGAAVVAKGNTNRWTARDQNPSLADLRLDLEAHGWPVAGQVGGIATDGHLEGSAAIVRRGELWDLAGNAQLINLSLTGERFKDGTARPGPVSIAWSLGQNSAGWTIRRLTVDSAVGSIKAEGGLNSELGFDSDIGEAGRVEGRLGHADRMERRRQGEYQWYPGRVDARLDLAAIARQIPQTLGLRSGLVVKSGSARLIAEVNGTDQSIVTVHATLADISADDGERRLDLLDPASFSAEVARTGESLTFKKLSGQATYLSASGSGTVDDLNGARRFAFEGEIKPDFEAVNAWLSRQVEPGAKLAGQPRSFRVGGSLAGSDPFGSVEGEVGFDLAGADVYGIQLGPTPVVVRARGGQILVDPISTTLNEGHIRLEPEVLLHDTQGDPVLRLGKNSSIRDARINDEMSRRVLAFVAPILEGATSASGRVSVAIDHAEIPLRSGRSKRAQLDGQVVFEDVAFAPGTLANDLLGAIGRRDATLKLDRPVTLTIADGRINQSGLALPVGDLTRIELAGWVDFDRNLALTATLPVTPAMLGNNALLSDIAAGTRIRLPIGGTLSRPTIDQNAFTASLKDLGKSLLTRGAARGALELLLRAGQPKDVNAPPPAPTLTPEERKARRQERKAERRIKRGAMPDASPNP